MEQNRQLKISIIDDDVITLEKTRHILMGIGFTEITTFESGLKFLDHLTENQQVVFLDHNMEEMTGFEVLKKIKRFDPDIYVVMHSSQQNMNVALDSLKHGAFDYVIKGAGDETKIQHVMKRIVDFQKILEKQRPSRWRSGILTL